VAHGTTTQYSSNVGIATVFAPSFVNAVFKNNHFLGLVINGKPLFPELKVGDTAYRWKVLSSANTSAAVFTEGAAAPTPVAITPKNAAVDYTYVWAWIRITGHVRDAMKNATPEGLNMVTQEFIGAQEDIVDVFNTGFMGASNAGLQVSVDSTTTYAGISRGSAAYWESSEAAVGGAGTLAALAEVIRDNDKGGLPGVWLTAVNQVTNYIRLMGVVAAANAAPRVEMTLAGGGSLDIGPSPVQTAFQGAPFIGLPDFTNTVQVALDTRMTKVGPKNGISIRRPFELRGPDMAADDDVWEASSAAALINHMPKLDGKNTGVTA
jgi:hypothetical protein